MTMIECPRARSSMTPCVARDGRLALDDGCDLPRRERQCVGCGGDPRELLRDLGDRYAPAKMYRQAYDRKRCADLLQRMVAEYVEAKR